MATYGVGIAEEPQTLEDKATPQHERRAKTVKHDEPADAEDEIPSWNEDEWVIAIKKHDPLQQANASLERSVEAFLQHASNDDRESLASAQSELTERIEAAKSYSNDEVSDVSGLSRRERIVRKIKSGYLSFSKTAYQYSAHLDLLASQAPEYVGPVWGAIKIILVMQVNRSEIEENIRSNILDISSKFEVLDHLTEFLPRANLIRAIGDAYAGFSNFLCEAVKFYGEFKPKKILKDFSHPWKIRFEPLILSIQEKLQHIRDIAQFHGLITGHMNYVLNRANLALSKDAIELTRETNRTLRTVLSKMEDPQNQEHGIKFVSATDINEIGAMFRQCVKEKLESLVKSQSPAARIQKDETEEKFTVTEDLLDVAQDLFPELQAETNAQAKMFKQLESRHENEPVIRQKTNIFRVSHILTWIESPTSQLLWIDGSHVLERANFATSFTAPLMIDAESNYGSCLFLRHFCGGHTIPLKNSYNVLLQALLFQMLQQRPKYYQSKKASITRDRTASTDELWQLLVECLREIDSDCTFIVIDGIDRVYGEEAGGTTNMIVKRFEGLVKAGPKLVKVLLSARLSKINQVSTDVSQALVLANQHERSNSIHENDLMLTPYKFVEMQERRSKTCTFNELIGLYLPGTTIFANEGGDLRAFVVEEVDGMQPISFNRLTPLLIKAFHIDHDGKRFVRKKRQFTIPYFAGMTAIQDLKQVPAGYLQNEHEQRAKLLKRGKKFWAWCRGVHYMWHPEGPGARGSCVVLDQSVAIIEDADRGFEEVDIKDRNVDDVKPLTLMLCPSSMMAFSMLDLSWKLVQISELKDLRFIKSRLKNLIVDEEIVDALLANIEACLVSNRNIRQGMNVKAVRGVRVLHGGFIALLHGPPSSGKRSLVYALSHTVNRPVMEMGPSYLGANVETFELRLKQYLHYAELWECIVLYRGEDDLLDHGSSGGMRDKAVLGSILTRNLELFSGMMIMITEMAAELSMTIRGLFNFISHIPGPDAETKQLMCMQFLKEIVDSEVVFVADDLKHNIEVFDQDEPNGLRSAIAELNLSVQELRSALRRAVSMAIAFKVQLNLSLIMKELKFGDKVQTYQTLPANFHGEHGVARGGSRY